MLAEAGRGDAAARDRVVQLLYEDLRRRARLHLRKRFGPGAGGVTLQPTALVNETYLRLLSQHAAFDNRDHFLAIATTVMLRVLTDYQRARGARKRGGDGIAVTLTGVSADIGESGRSAAAVADVLEKLDALDARKGQIVKLRAIWGFEMAEIAAALDLSLSTVEREWRFGKAWLAEELDDRAG